MSSLSIADEMQTEINKEARALSLNLLRGLVRVTPVDTGRAKGNWFVGLNTSVRSIDGERKQATALSDGVIRIGNAKALDYPEIVLSNNLPYIEKLDGGSSEQAPKMFVQIEIDRVSK